jgi:hypothetical protein
MADLATLYEGAQLGQAFSKKLGQFQAESDQTYNYVRGDLLKTAVATGKLNPASLSQSDASLLNQNVSQGGFGPHLIPSTSHPKGLLGEIGAVVAKPFEWGVSNAGQLASLFAHAPAGLFEAGKAAYRTEVGLGKLFSSGKYEPPPGPDEGTVAKAMAVNTIHDFTNFDPNHAIFPILDVLSLATLGQAGAVRLGAGLARVGEEGSTAARVGAAIERATKPGERTELKLAGQPTGETPGDYSIAPFRRTFIEKPIDWFFASGKADRLIPGSESKTYNDLRTEYWIRKISHVAGGRESSGVVKNTYDASKPFAKGMENLTKESDGSRITAWEKFNALTLRRELNADNLTEAERSERLDDYIKRVLNSPLHDMEIQGVATKSIQSQRLREYYDQLIRSDRYREFFVKGTGGMDTMRQVWDQTNLDSLRAVGLDPRELLNRALGPVAYLYEKSPEEMLREEPQIVQDQTRFGIEAKEIEDAIREGEGKHVMQEALAGTIAKYLPSSATVIKPTANGVGTVTAKVGINLARRTKLVRDAIQSLKMDIIEGPRTYKDEPWYLQGNTLAQKVATGLHDRFGVETHIAEPYSIGAFTNFFPQVSAMGLKPRPEGFRLGRAAETLSRGRLQKGAHQLRLHEYRKEPTLRLLTAQTLGVAPYYDFLHESTLGHFEAGLERRDVDTFVRHIAQRERVLLFRMLRAPLIKRLALKGPDGEPLWFKSFTDLQNYIGDTEKAKLYVLVPHLSYQKMIQSETDAAREAAAVLKSSDGRVTPAVSSAINHTQDEEVQNFVHQVADDVIKTGDKMVALPRTFFDDLMKQNRIYDGSTRIVTKFWQAFINRWRTAVLAYMPAWLLRTSIGHGLLLIISGVTNPKHYFEAVTYFKDGFHIPFTEKAVPGPLGKGLERDIVPGVEQGTPHEDFGRFGGQRVALNRLAQINTHGVHRIANFQRRAAFLKLLEKTARQRWGDLEEAFKLPRMFKADTYDYIIENHPELVHHALNELDRVSYTFGQMSPWERNLARNFLPFWGWYKFVNKFIWSLPITYPGRALAIARLGEIGQSQQDALGPIPDWLHSAVMFDTHNLSAVHYLSMLGLNPLGDAANPAGGPESIIRLGQFSPIIQAGLEAAGYNTLTGGLEEIDPTSGIEFINGQYYNVHTGQVAESPGAASPLVDAERFLGGLLRGFPEVRIAEPFTTGGRAVYPESIPFVYEKIIPGSKPKPVNPLNTLLQYTGVQPRTYDLAHWQANRLKNLSRALGEYNKAIQKSEAIR